MRPILFHNLSSDDEEDKTSQQDLSLLSQTAIKIKQQYRIKILGLLKPDKTNSHTFLGQATITQQYSVQNNLPTNGSLGTDNSQGTETELTISQPQNQIAQQQRRQTKELNQKLLRVVKFVDHQDQNNLKTLKNEIQSRFLIGRNYRQFLKCYGVTQSSDPLVLVDDNGEQYEFLQGHSFVVYEYCEQGNLWDGIMTSKTDKQNFVDDSEKIKNIFKQIFEGISILHTKLQLAHLNLTLKNIFLDKDYNPKIGGFQNVKHCNYIKMKFLQKYASETDDTQYYLSPEIQNILLNQTEQNTELQYLSGEKIDIFALGVMLFIALFRRQPFSKATKTDFLYNMLIQGTQLSNEQFFKLHPATRRIQIDKDLKTLLISMMNNNPDKRPNIQEVLQSPWFISINSQSI